MSTTTVTTSEVDVTFPSPCPDWCTLVGRAEHQRPHEYAENNRLRRTHAGPHFGDHFEAFADEYLDEPGVLRYGINHNVDDDYGAVDYTDAGTLAEVSRAAIAAGNWLLDRQMEQAAPAQPADLPWYATADNPSCVDWCEDTHSAAEFSVGGGFLCTKSFLNTDTYKVEVNGYVGLNDAEDGYGERRYSVYTTCAQNGDAIDDCDALERYADALTRASWFVGDCRRKDAAVRRAAERKLDPSTAPWWRMASNPPCSPWCDLDHPEGDFAFGGGMSCTKTIVKTDDFEVKIGQYHGINEDGTPDVIETDPIEVYVSAPVLHDEYLAPDRIARLLPALAAAVEQAIAEAQA